MLNSKVIIINGASSSGKSSLSRLLQLKLKDPYMLIGIDKMIEMMPEQINNWEGKIADQGFWWETFQDKDGNKLQTLQIGPYARKVSDSLVDVVVTLANNGLNVIVDEVCLSYETAKNWQNKLKKFDTFYIGLITPIEVLESREKLRDDRINGSARGQYEQVHKYLDYDLEINTANNTLDECIAIIVNNYDV